MPHCLLLYPAATFDQAQQESACERLVALGRESDLMVFTTEVHINDFVVSVLPEVLSGQLASTTCVLGFSNKSKPFRPRKLVGLTGLEPTT